jgi:hypothetical protein
MKKKIFIASMVFIGIGAALLGLGALLGGFSIVKFI